jgi:hypothetical protein
LEESVKGLNAYRTRSNGNDMNLSGSVQLKSTMLEMQERHSDSRGGGLNESLRRIFGRGLHSSAFRLNLSAFCRIGVHLWVV